MDRVNIYFDLKFWIASLASFNISVPALFKNISLLAVKHQIYVGDGNYTKSVSFNFLKGM